MATYCGIRRRVIRTSSMDLDDNLSFRPSRYTLVKSCEYGWKCKLVNRVDGWISFCFHKDIDSFFQLYTISFRQHKVVSWTPLQKGGGLLACDAGTRVEHMEGRVCNIVFRNNQDQVTTWLQKCMPLCPELFTRESLDMSECWILYTLSDQMHLMGSRQYHTYLVSSSSCIEDNVKVLVCELFCGICCPVVNNLIRSEILDHLSVAARANTHDICS